jgi:hypothetical protein
LEAEGGWQADGLAATVGEELGAILHATTSDQSE